MKKDERNKVVREKLKKSLLFRIVAINPNSSSTINSPNISSFIDSRLQHPHSRSLCVDPAVFFLMASEPVISKLCLIPIMVIWLFSSALNPFWMIKRAVKELNEESGLTEEAISEFIRREYEDLPFARARMLYTQLTKLCNNGHLVCKNGKYVLKEEEEE
ncbi:winged-helix DNA-binding transcription factor family protein [Trifolium repens]|nr:winged-helix DNA-binding transcription factor family protein [Trifolium repens]